MWGKRIKIGYGFSFTKNFHRDISPILAPNVNGTASSEGGNFYDGASGAGLSNFYLDPTRVDTIGGSTPATRCRTRSRRHRSRSPRSGRSTSSTCIIDSFAYGHSCDVERAAD